MLGNIRLVFSDIHIDMFSSKEEIEKAKYKIFDKLRNGFVKYSKNPDIKDFVVDLFIPWDFINIQETEEKKEFEQCEKLITFMSVVKEFCNISKFKINKVFFCLWNHDYYSEQDKDLLDSYSFQELLISIFKSVLEIPDENVHLLEYWEVYDKNEDDFELILWNILYSPCENIWLFEFNKISDSKYIFSVWRTIENKNLPKLLFPFLNEKEHKEIFKPLFSKREFRFVEDMYDEFIKINNKIVNGKGVLFLDYTRWFFFWNFLSLVFGLIAYSIADIKRFTFVLHFPFDFRNRFGVNIPKKEYEDKKLDSFFNVRLEWLNKLLLVVKELYPNVSMINFYSWHNHEPLTLSYEENWVLINYVNNSFWYFNYEWK